MELAISDHPSSSLIFAKHTENRSPKEHAGTLGLDDMHSTRLYAEAKWSRCSFTGRSTYHDYLGISLLVMMILLPLHVRALCTTPDCVPRDGWDNFANNLGSDLAPFLALFGEQVTTQYMSESLDWIDNILLALAPLGIITILVSAIRVSGAGRLKSLIGRGRETRSAVETDLLSSTSSEVCELWSGGGVLRVVGTAALLQLIWVPGEVGVPGEAGVPDDKSCGLYNFRKKASRDRHYTKKRSGGSQSKRNGSWGNPEKPAADQEDTPDDQEDKPGDQEDTPDEKVDRNPPNISLNLSVKSVSRLTLIVFIIIGIIVQATVLVLAAVSQYVLHWPKNDLPISFYAFPVLCAGTIFLGVGILLCAHTVEKTTGEIIWVPRKPEPKRGTFVLWLQQGGQEVGDQEFESFAQWSEGEIISSYRRDQEGKNYRKELVFVAGTFTLLGFIAQLVGLRAAHSSVTVLQLVAVIIVTVFRSFAHSKRDKKNKIEKPKQVEGFELDWLAKYLGGITSLEVDTSGIPAAQRSRPTTAVPTGSQPPELRPTTARLTAPTGVMPSDSSRTRETQTDETGVTLILSPQQALEVRSCLGNLSISPEHEWKYALRENVNKLRTAIEMTMNDVHSKMNLRQERLRWSRLSFSWDVPVVVEYKSSIGQRDLIKISLTRQQDDLNGCSDWRIDGHEFMLEAVLGLWVSSLIEERRSDDRSKESIWHIGPATDEFKREYRVWMHPSVPDKSTKRSDEGTRHFGWPTRGKDDDSLYVKFEANRTVQDICTLQLYFMFLHRLAKEIQNVGGETMLFGGIAAPSQPTARPPGFKLINTNLVSIADIFKDSGLGNIEEAYYCIIPAFQNVEKPSLPREVFDDALNIPLDSSAKRETDWRSSLDIDFYLNDALGSLGLSRKEINTAEAQLFKRLCSLREAFISSYLSTGEDKILHDLEPMWNGLYLRCKLISTKRPLSSISLDLMVLCLTRYRMNEDYDIKELHELLQSTIKSLNPDVSSEEISKKITEEHPETFKDPELLSRFVWLHARNDRTVRVPQSQSKSGQNINTTQLPEIYGCPPSHHSASKVIIETRQKLKYMFGPEPFDKYADNDDSIKLMAEMSVKKAFDSGGAGDRSIPVDLLLIEGYRTPLQMAAELGKMEVVKKILDFWGSDREFITVLDYPAAEDGRTALQAAAGGGHIEIVKILLDAGAPINAEAAETSGRTALQAAIEGGHKEIVPFLIESGANVNGKSASNYGITALEAAAANRDIKIVDLLLEKKADVNPVPSNYGRTPLQAAAEAGCNEVIELLLAQGANINAPPADCGGRSALQGAAEKGHLKAVELLLDKGARVDDLPAKKSGCTALYAAVCSGQRDIVEMLLKNRTTTPGYGASSEMRRALYTAVERGHDEVVKILLVKGAPIYAHETEPEGKTILQAALHSGDAGVIESILTAPFDLEAAIHYALIKGHEDVTSNLLTNDKLDINRSDSDDGLPPLLRAVALNRVEVIEWLVARDGLNVNSKDNDGNTALSIAAEAGRNLIVEMLLERQSHINHANNQGLTPLTLASSNCHVEVVQALLANPRISTKILSKTKCTCLLAAVASNGRRGVTEEKIKSVVEMILGHESARDLENGADEGGITPLIKAATCGLASIIETLLSREGIHINAEDCYHNTAFSTASEKKDWAILFLLLNDQRLELDSEILGKYISEKPLMLHEALNRKADVLFRRLLKSPHIKAQLNATDTEGNTPLMIAVRQKRLDIVVALLECESVELGETVLSMETSPEVKKLLKDHPRGTNREKPNPSAPGTSTAHTQENSANPLQESSSRRPSREL